VSRFEWREVGAIPTRELLVTNIFFNNMYQVNLYNIVMVTELNSVHKNSESPLHWSGRQRETIPDYLEGVMTF